MTKKSIIAAAAMVLTSGAVADAQTKGQFEVYNLGEFRLHVYNTNDALGDASFIVESGHGLVTIEQPLFKDNVAEYDAYVANLAKPVVKRIADYHVGGTGSEPYVMPEGMPAFAKGDVYGGMMAGFAQMFGAAIVDLPTGTASEAAYGETHRWAGVDFVFARGVATDFPAASITIGGKVRHTHWAPSRSHVSALQVGSMEALDAHVADLEAALQSGATVFTGSHGGAAGADDVLFRIGYLAKAKALASQGVSATEFVKAMTAAYPALPGESNLEALAKALGLK